jgi:DNA repair protein RadD
MQPTDRFTIEQVLKRIPSAAWDAFLASSHGASLQTKLSSVRDTLRRIGRLTQGAPGRPVSEVIDLLGHDLLSDPSLGQWLRKQLLLTLPSTKFIRLAADFSATAGLHAEKLHGNMKQHGAASRIMSEYWHQGSEWSRCFCETVGLPGLLAARRSKLNRADEVIMPPLQLPPLHGFQLDVYPALSELLRGNGGTAAMLSLPTGAGKTRTIVEAICDHLSVETLTQPTRNVVLWISQSNELQEQAWECFSQVWQAPAITSPYFVSRKQPLRICRLWGSRNPDEIEFNENPTVLVAGIDQLHSWVRRRDDFFNELPSSRLLCVVIDEAHSLITKQYQDVLIALNIRSKESWKLVDSAPSVFGLSATPWRKTDDEDAMLRKYFRQGLLRPNSLGQAPITSLQKLGILARVNAERLSVTGTPRMSSSERKHFDIFKELPPEYLERLGISPERNAQILRRLLDLPSDSRCLVFACSVEHAKLLALAINCATDGISASVVTSRTGRTERASIIERFRSDETLRFLCNVGVLANGFDAPKLNVVCVTRPTMSALKYEQMIGRGLRGPKNGGTNECLVLDVQDAGLPTGIMSYERVARLWDTTES